MKDWYKIVDDKLAGILCRDGKKTKTIDRVFDKRTILTFYRLFLKKKLDIVDFPISTGKEADVYRGVTPEKKFVAVKVYRYNPINFRKFGEYILGDHRFDDSSCTGKNLIYEWVKKEFSNLKRLKNAGVRVPQPIVYLNNILIMDYLGNKTSPAPLLGDAEIEKPEEVLKDIIRNVKKAYQRAGIVHADLSPFNIMYFKKKIWLFDVSQSVPKTHPSAEKFLGRDINNLAVYFKKKGISIDKEEIKREVMGKQ